MEPVWRALLAHHGEVSEHVPPVRDPEDSWARCREDYHHWMAQPGSFCLAFEDHRRVLGYAFVRVAPGDETWRTGERIASLETLAVLPEARGSGAGTALMDAVDAELQTLGIEDLFVGVLLGNVDALRFYERRGFRRYSVRMYRRQD